MTPRVVEVQVLSAASERQGPPFEAALVTSMAGEARRGASPYPKIAWMIHTTQATTYIEKTPMR